MANSHLQAFNLRCTWPAEAKKPVAGGANPVRTVSAAVCEKGRAREPVVHGVRRLMGGMALLAGWLMVVMPSSSLHAQTPLDAATRGRDPGRARDFAAEDYRVDLPGDPQPPATLPEDPHNIGPIGGVSSRSPQAGSGSANTPAPSRAFGGRGIDAARYLRVKTDAGPAPPQGQVWREYDLRPYLDRVRGLEEPAKPLIDWILRETGTERWFGDVPGMISFEADRLRVYQTPEVHEQVATIIERYVSPELTSMAVSVRLVTVDNVSWRAVAAPMMTPLRVETPGVEAWLLTREQAALLMAHLRQRVDYREHNSAQSQIAHGQTHRIERWQPRTYRQSVRPAPMQLGAGGYQIQMGQVREGYRMELSPLATEDRSMVDVRLKCGVDQLERLSSVSIDVPGVKKRVALDVPQVSSWSLHERFRWPVGHVLLVSRGMVAMPGLKRDDNGPLPDLLANRPARADALLFLECRDDRRSPREGPARSLVPQASRLNYHNRY